MLTLRKGIRAIEVFVLSRSSVCGPNEGKMGLCCLAWTIDGILSRAVNKRVRDLFFHLIYKGLAFFVD